MELRYVNSLFFRRFGTLAVTITSVISANELGVVFAGLSNGCIIAWDLRYEPSPLARVVVYNAHKGAVHALCWQPYYCLLFSGSVDGVIKIWDPSFTDFLDVSGTTTDHSALAQIFANEKSNPIIQRYKYTVQPMITEEETVSSTTSAIKLTRLVQTLGDFSGPITKIAYASHHIVALSLDGYITLYYPDPHRDLTLLKYPLFIKIARVFLGHQQLDRITNFATLQLGYNLQEPIHKDSVLENHDLSITNYAYQRAITTPSQSVMCRTPSVADKSILKMTSQVDQGHLDNMPAVSRETQQQSKRSVSVNHSDCTTAPSIKRRNDGLEVTVPLDYTVNPLLTEPVMPTSLVVDADNSGFYVGDSNGIVHCLAVLDGKLSYKSRIKHASNNSVIDSCFLPRESGLIVAGADGTVRGIITMTGKTYSWRISPKGITFFRVLHCPKRKLIEYEDLISSQPNSVQLMKRTKGKTYTDQTAINFELNTEVMGLSNTLIPQTLYEQQMDTMLRQDRNREIQQTISTKTNLTALFMNQSDKDSMNETNISRYNATVEKSMQIDSGDGPNLKQHDDNVILLSSNGLLQIVDFATNSTLLEAMYSEIGPLPAVLMAKATDSGVFLTTPIITHPRRSLNYRFYAIAKMSLSLQEEYWILRGRFARTMAKMDQKLKLEHHMITPQKKDAQQSQEYKQAQESSRASSKIKKKNTIESMDKKISATKVDILNQYDDMRIQDMFLLKLPPDLNPNGEVIIGIVRPTCIDFLRPIYKHVNKARGIGHSKPVQLLSILLAPNLPHFDEHECLPLAASSLTQSKSSLITTQSGRHIPPTDSAINPILQRSNTTLIREKAADGTRALESSITMADMIVVPTESVTAAASGYYKQRTGQEISNASESQNLDVLSNLDDPISEEYLTAQSQQKLAQYRSISVRSKMTNRDNKDFVNAIINGDISISQGTKEPGTEVYTTHDIIHLQLASISEMSMKLSTSSYDIQNRMATLAKMRQSAISNLTTSKSEKVKMSGSANLTLQELQTNEEMNTTIAVACPQTNQFPEKMNASRLNNLIFSKRIFDSQINKINKPEAQAAQLAPYLPPETDIVHHIVSHHTDANGRLPLITRSGPRSMVQKKLMPPFFLLSGSFDNDIYVWDSRIMSRPYHHYSFSFDTLKYARILNLSQVTGIVLDAASILFHKYLIDGAKLATKSTSLDITNSYAFDLLRDSQIGKLLLSKSKSKHRDISESDERMMEIKESNRFDKQSSENNVPAQQDDMQTRIILSSKMHNVSERVKREQLKKEAEIRQDEMFSRLFQGISGTGKKFQSSTAQKNINGVRSSNYTNYHVDDSDIRVRLLKLGKSGLLDKDAVKSLINQVPTEVKLQEKTTKDMSFLDFDRFYVLHPDAISMASTFLNESASAEDAHLGISPNYAGQISKDSIYNIINRNEVMPPELVCNMEATSIDVSDEKHNLLKKAQMSGINLDVILSEEHAQTLNQFNQQVYFEIKKLAELPDASCFLAIAPQNFLLIGHEDGSLTAMTTIIKQGFRSGKTKRQLSSSIPDCDMLHQTINASEQYRSYSIVEETSTKTVRQTNIFRVLAGHSESISCICYVLTEQCCYIYTASIDGTILCLIHPMLGDFRLQYNSWSKFVSIAKTGVYQIFEKGDKKPEANDGSPFQTQNIPESIEFLQGSKTFLIAGTNLANIYFITLPLQSPLRATLFFECIPFMQAYFRKEESGLQLSSKKVEGGNHESLYKEPEVEKLPSFYIKYLNYCHDTLTIVLESGYVLQFGQVSLHYMHWMHLLNTGKLAVDPSKSSHYFSRISHGTSPDELILSNIPTLKYNPHNTIPLPPKSPYFEDYFSIFLPNFPFKLMPHRVFSIYTPLTREPASTTNIFESYCREVTHASQENKIITAYVIFSCTNLLMKIASGCQQEHQNNEDSIAKRVHTQSNKYSSVKDVIEAYDPLSRISTKPKTVPEKLFYINGKALERPINQALDQGRKYYDEVTKEWKTILDNDLSTEKQSIIEESPHKRPPTILLNKSRNSIESRSKSTTPMRYINTSIKPVKTPQSIQRSTSLNVGMASRSALGKPVVSLDIPKNPIESPVDMVIKNCESIWDRSASLKLQEDVTNITELHPNQMSEYANSFTDVAVCISYASGLVRIYRGANQVIASFKYDSPVCSFQALQLDDMSEQILRSMTYEMRIIAATTIWMGLADGRIVMERCSALIEEPSSQLYDNRMD